jgi:hypothetical protein
MRVTLLLLFATPAVAAPKKAPKTAAVATPKAVDLTLAGTLRESEALPEVPLSVTGDVATGAPDKEHGPAAEVKRDAPAQLSDGALAALAERQMRKNTASIEACVAEEAQRNPQAAGAVTLHISVTGRKVGHLAMDDDTVKSAALTDCLTKASQGWSFSLKTAEFTYPISIGKHR